MDERSSGVAVLTAEDAGTIVSVFGEAFRDYPVMRFVLGEEGDYDARLHKLVTLFVMARVLRGEDLLGVRDIGGLGAAAIVSDPQGPPSPDAFVRLRGETWATLGEGARARYEAFGAATATLNIGTPHIHLNMIGVRPSHQGRGLAGRLLHAVHELSAHHETSRGVTLTTEAPGNVSLYERFGYEVVGSVEVGGAFTSWSMYREDRPGE